MEEGMQLGSDAAYLPTSVNMTCSIAWLPPEKLELVFTFLRSVDE
jgi:hypothetical protein